MTPELINYKQTFRIMLLPMMELFEHKKTILTPDQWIKFIGETKSSIISNPEQFLGKDLPNKLLIGQIVGEIFADFLELETV